MNSMNYTSFQDPCIKYPIDNLELTFTDYIATCRNIIERVRTDLTQNQSIHHIITANAPFELKPANPLSAQTRYGALLIHGLFDCPFIMRDIGNMLQAQGLLVRSILLPGHGTVPGDLLRVKYQDWLQATYYGIHNLAQDVDKIFLVGFSTGASLALYHSLQASHEKIAALLLLAPAIQISRLGFIANLPPKLSFLSKRLDWLHITEENDYTKYQSITFNAAHQIYLLTQAIKHISEIKFLKHPVFVGISADDKTVSSNATIRYFYNHSCKKSQLLIYTNQPNALHDTRFTIRPASYPDMSIINISHTAIPIAPDNPHYGIDGDYPLASHINTNLRQGKPCQYGTQNNFINAICNKLHRAGLYPHEYQRVTFNPDFDFLAKSIQRFIEKIISS